MKHPLRYIPAPTQQEFIEDPVGALNTLRAGWFVLIRRGRVLACFGAASVGSYLYLLRSLWHQEREGWDVLHGVLTVVNFAALCIGAKMLVRLWWQERLAYRCIAEIEGELNSRQEGEQC